MRFLLQKFLPLNFFSLDVSALGDQQFGRDQLSFLAECQRVRRTVFLDYPFDGDAGIDYERVHRSLRPSRRRTSEGVWGRRLVNFRRSAANVSKDGSTSPIRVWWRISRCSASVERPCRLPPCGTNKPSALFWLALSQPVPWATAVLVDEFDPNSLSVCGGQD